MHFPARRFARLDQKGNRTSQQLLFGEVRAQQADTGEAYSSGFTLGGLELASGRAAAELLSTVPVGCWTPGIERGVHLRDTEQPLLVAWERFDSLRAQRREGSPAAPEHGDPSATLFT